MAQSACIGEYCMVGSYVYSRQNIGGTYTVDWGAQMDAEISAAVKEIYKAFLRIATNKNLDPDLQVPVQVQYKGGVWNVTLDCNSGTGCTVNPNNANATGWPDPVTFVHHNPSWYSGPWYAGFGFSVGHLIGSDPASAHIDPFGPLNPLHYLIQMPAMLFPSGPAGYTTCSINGGCN